MPAYMLVQIEAAAEDRDALMAYAAKVPPIIARYGGRYLALAGPDGLTALEGGHPPRSGAIVEFPDEDAVQAFWNSPEYAEVRPMRAGRGKVDVWLIPGFTPPRG